MIYQYMYYYCCLVYHIDIILRKIQGDLYLKYHTLLKHLCEIFFLILSTVIIVTYFVRGHHCVFVTAVVTGEWYIFILQTLRFCVYYFCYCILVYDDSVILLCFILNCHSTFIFLQISNIFICGIFEHNFFAADKAIHNLQFWITSNK